MQLFREICLMMSIDEHNYWLKINFIHLYFKRYTSPNNNNTYWNEIEIHFNPICFLMYIVWVFKWWSKVQNYEYLNLMVNLWWLQFMWNVSKLPFVFWLMGLHGNISQKIQVLSKCLSGTVNLKFSATNHWELIWHGTAIVDYYEKFYEYPHVIGSLIIY